MSGLAQGFVNSMQQQQQPGSAPQPGAPGAPPPSSGLPPTGLQQQIASLQSFYSAAQGQGVNAYGMQPQQALPGGGVPSGSQPNSTLPGQTNIQQLAKSMASTYGLQFGRGELVDPNGNFMVTPEQLSAASGGSMTMGQAAAKMNYIGQAIANEQNRQQQSKGIAALSQGLGLVQSRAPGSLAALQSGFYQDIADMYGNQEYQAADYSYYIEEERLQIQREIQRKAEKRAKRGGILGSIGSVLGGVAGGIFGGPVGASIGSSLGGGLGQAAGSWF